MIHIFMIGMSKDKGGVEAYISNVCNQLTQKYEVVYCLPHMEISGTAWDCPPNRHNYVRYYHFWTRFFRKNHFDVLYYNTCDIVSIDMLRFAKAAGIPVRIIHSHNTDNQLKMTLFHRITEKINRAELHRYATHLFACSQNAGEWMFGKREFTLIQNGILLRRYEYSEQSGEDCRNMISIENCILVGCVGRLDPQKNPLFTIKIAKELCHIVPNLHLVMIGDGELRAQVAETIVRYGIAERVHLLGARDDVYRWYSAFDCLLMPSLFEGLPFVLVEAQAAGLPCVVSDAVSHEANITGLLEYVSLEKSPREWAEIVWRACQKTRQNTTQKLIDAGYSIENTATQVSKIIDTAMEKRHDKKSHS